MSDKDVLIDTSVWVDYFRGKGGEAGRAVDGLLDADRVLVLPLIEAELYRGARTEKELKFLEGHFSFLRQLDIPAGFWRKVGRFSWQLSRKGYLPHLVDAFIALTAIENGVMVFSRDNDFKKIAALSELKLFVSPP